MEKRPGLVRALNFADARWRRNFLAAAAAQLTEAMIVRGHRVAYRLPHPAQTDRERQIEPSPPHAAMPAASHPSPLFILLPSVFGEMVH